MPGQAETESQAVNPGLAGVTENQVPEPFPAAFLDEHQQEVAF